MHGADLSAIPQLVWGIDAKIVAAAIVIMAYVILFTEKLNRAVELQRDGADMERIRKETGWYTGADAMMRCLPMITEGCCGHWKNATHIDKPRKERLPGI